jgi:hypothetical protein
MAEATAPEPNRNFGNTQLDMSQPDGVPREQARNSDGTFKEKPSETPATPNHPAYLSELAKSFGFDDDDMKSMSSEALGRAITKAQKRDAEWNQRLQSQKPQPQAKAPEPEPEFDLGVDLKEIDEGVAGAFEKLKQARIQDAKELKELRKAIAENQERERARSQQQATQLVDDAFEALGPEYEEYFGKGSVDDIAKDPKLLRRRIIALQETGLNVEVASGKQILSKLKKVADEVLGIKPKAKEEPEPEARPNGRPTRREWNAAGTALPTQRSNAEEPKGYERAVRNAERKAAANGGPVTPSHAKEDAEILATFPKR